ncbi:unnamed protein product [Prorocentrum cordatum]|uniref:Uncharacterized protein n=1 Tax=Prorocentrum cordatum TaxID=2364126 RepID=A0ABN9RF18_9DINO|nr:unnamed protein product [Polarella glacialis]
MQAMRAEGLQPTAATWTWLIVSTGVDLGGASSKKTPEAVFRDMVAAGVAPTAFTRSALDRQLPDGAAQRKRLFAELGVADPADDPYAARHAVKPLAVKSVQRRRSEVRAQLRSIDRRRTMKAKVAATRRIMMEVDRVEVTPKKVGGGQPPTLMRRLVDCPCSVLERAPRSSFSRPAPAGFGPEGRSHQTTFC